MSRYERTYGTDWTTLDPDDAIERAYALGVAASLEEYHPDELEAMRRALEERSIDARIIYSSGRDLDFLPAGANKGTAAAFVARELGVSPRDGIACGDSGNDRPMFQQGFRGVIVANAQPELRELTGPDIYHADESYADGVLEGISYWWKDDEPD